MNKKAKVSIIVPVYNCEKYLSKCLDSLSTQTYKNIEIIVVNDGSTDNSINIVKEKSKKDKRIIIIDQKNSGVSTARNNGLKKAIGEYVVFVDSDDYLANDFVNYMLELITTNDSDFAYSIKKYIKKDEKQSLSLTKKKVSSNESVAILLNPDTTVGCWNKIYKRKFLEENNLYFLTNLYYGEGLNFIIRTSLATDKIIIGNKKVYFYRKDNMSSATTKYNNQKYHNGEKSLELIRSIIDLKDEKVKAMYNLHLSTFYLGTLTKMIEYKKTKEYKDDYKRWRKALKKNLLYIIRSKYISHYRKAMILGGFLFPHIIAKLDIVRTEKIIKDSV